MTDVDLADVNRREQRLTNLVTGLGVAVILLLGLVVAELVLLRQGNDEGRQRRCQTAITLRYLTATVRTIAAADADQDELVSDLVAAGIAIETALAANIDPCEIEIPAVVVDR